MIKVLFVCMGNICRSPTAEGVFRKIVTEQGLAHRIEIDSAGTHAYHVGEPPDPRSQQAALRRGLDLSNLRARRVQRNDFAEFDYVLAMDEDNRALLEAMAPPGAKAQLELFLQYAAHLGERNVPDPYYGGAAGFERVLDLVEAASQGLLEALQRRHFG